jgi:uncharacterized membrane protein
MVGSMKALLQLAILAKCLALLVWVGGIIFFAFAAAPLAFQEPVQEITGGTHVSGMIVNSMLERFTLWQAACAAVILIALVLQIRLLRVNRGRRIVQLIAALVMTALLAWCGLLIGPRMNALGEEIGNFNDADQTSEAYLEFDALHHRYSRLMGINLILGLGLFVTSIVMIPSAFRDRERATFRGLGL